MSELKEASDRLEQAIERLDRALANGRQTAEDARSLAMAGTIAAVERERDSLRADLDALRLERAFGVSAAFWLNLQSPYELEVARRDAGKTIEKSVRRLSSAA